MFHFCSFLTSGDTCSPSLSVSLSLFLHLQYLLICLFYPNMLHCSSCPSRFGHICKDLPSFALVAKEQRCFSVYQKPSHPGTRTSSFNVGRGFGLCFQVHTLLLHVRRRGETGLHVIEDRRASKNFFCRAL